MVHYFFIFVLNCYCWVIFVLSSYIFIYIYIALLFVMKIPFFKNTYLIVVGIQLIVWSFQGLCFLVTFQFVFILIMLILTFGHGLNITAVTLTILTFLEEQWL